MPWTIDQPPPPAKNWTEAQKKRCVSAANAALQRGKSEEEAIFACIGAAGVVKTKQHDAYDALAEEGSQALQRLVELFFAGAITLSVFRRMFSGTLRQHLRSLMLLGFGTAELSAAAEQELSRRMAAELALLGGFISALRDETTTQERALYRAGLYAYNRPVFVYGTLSLQAADLMPVLPGEDCLGNGLCHCSLREERDGNEIRIYWELSPESESCAVCIAHAVESPFIFTVES